MKLLFRILGTDDHFGKENRNTYTTPLVKMYESIMNIKANTPNTVMQMMSSVMKHSLSLTL